MNIYVTRAGRRTTVSIEPQLVDYLTIRLGKSGDHDTARRWIQLHIDAAGESVPERGLSRWAQALVLRAIVDPALKSEQERVEDAQQSRLAANLQERRYAQWKRDEAERSRLERRAKEAMKEVPRYKRKPKQVPLP
ncbi:hypothetical protein EBQ24_03505 [Allofranklinella schreckenbergeri]|uniref:Uncharacterized protein n=1 Tax=Allofranklinella schreckenbergeri TaxID=1076744 RepID=A0A3M6R5Y8_9BURK|nr:hypothetical protein [Allofranklinella schreckenbergeri]RMX10683.1 hypothetical protein EBQ24_03505 [Allofranklinella schreckenbergeri]